MLRSILFCAALAATAAAHADSEIDTSFGIFGTGHNVIAINGGGSNADYVADVLTAPDDSLYLVGSSNVPGTNEFRISLVHLKPNGQLDTAFGDGGKYVAPITTYNTLASSAAFNANGDIVVGGTRRSGTTSDFVVCQFHGAGTVPFADSALPCKTVAFDLGGGNQDVCKRMMLLPDGRILLMGYAEGSGGKQEGALALLRADGSPDPQFGIGGKVHTLGDSDVYETFYAAALTGDTLFAVGESSKVGSVRGALTVKVALSTGMVVTTHSDYIGSASGPAIFRDIVNQPTVGLTAVGSVMKNGKMRGAIARLGSVGQMDTSWSTDGFATIGASETTELTRLLPQSDGKFLVAGELRSDGNTGSRLFVGRVTAGGSFDVATFNILQGYRSVDFQTPGAYDGQPTLALQAGRPILAGSVQVAQGSTDYDFGVARLQIDRLFTARFGLQPGAD